MSTPAPIKDVIQSKPVEKIEKKPKGGARKGAGMPKGKITRKKLEQLTVQRAFNQLVMRGATRLFNAQFNKALGEQQLFIRYYTGKGKDRKRVVEQITDPEVIKEYIIDDGLTLNQKGNDEYYYISTKPADNQAIDSLLNRALGRAPEKLEVTGGFFSKSKLTIEVVGDRTDITADPDSAVIEGEVTEDGPQAEPAPEPSPSTP